MAKTRVAILIELPKGEAIFPALRRLLKILLRGYGLKCLACVPPDETRTFQPQPKADGEKPSS